MTRRGAGVGALAAVLGAATTLSFAPVGWWWLQAITLGGLALLWRTAGPRECAMSGFFFGLGWFTTGISWVYVSMHVYGAMPGPVAALATLLFAAYLALFPALAGYAQARLRVSGLAQSVFVLPACWCLCEWLRGWLFTGFPWLAAGYAHTDGVLSGIGPIAGVHALNFVAAQAGALLAEVAVMRATPHALALGLLIAASFGTRGIEWTERTGEPTTIALIQGNISQDLKFEEGRFAATLAVYQGLVEAHPATLTVLPETALPRMWQAVPAVFLDRIADSARARRGDVIVGVPFAESRERYFNSAVSLGTSPSQRYDKAHLVPFGEFIPFGFRWFVDWMRIPLGDFTSGTSAPSPLRLGNESVAINICYEDLFGEEIIRQLPQATVLVNISNIAWFGDSLAPHQHLQISRMRALESGRPMLRATNTGFTAVIEANGRVVDRLPLFTEGALRASVQGRAGSTPFARTGNWPIVSLSACVLAVALLRRRVRSVRAPA